MRLLNNRALKVFGLLFIFSFLVLFVLSPDSYIYDLYHRCDTAWFFMCGKAWMNGLVPYVDFADSKGLLLWLIYGLGYLINNNSYVGVFWISCFFFTFSFWYAYKLGRLYLGRNASVVLVSCMPLVLFWIRYHYEVRAEDFCYPFVLASLYYVCKILRGVDRKELFRYSFYVGVCLTCTLMIKWSVTLMMGGFAVTILCYSVPKKLKEGISGGLLGMLVMAIPFLVYLGVQGNFTAFIREYFCNTYSTTMNKTLGDTIISYLHGCLALNKPLVVLGVVIFLFCKKYKLSYSLIFSYLTFLAIAVIAPFRHYYTTLMPFCVLLLIMVLDILEKRLSFTKPIAVMMSLLCITFGIWFNWPSDQTLVFMPEPNRQQYYDISQLMAQVRNPKVMVSDYESGIGVAAGSLPACKYWARQTNASEEMLKERHEALIGRKADFVMTEKDNPKSEFTAHDLENHGYVYCGEAWADWTAKSVYCKKEIYKSLPHYKLNTTDLLLKRKLHL